MVTLKLGARSKTWYETFESDEEAKEKWFEARHKEKHGALLIFRKINPVTFKETGDQIGP